MLSRAGIFAALAALSASLALMCGAPARALAAPGSEACSGVSLSFGFDPTGTMGGTASCTIGGRSGSVSFTGTYAYSLSCPDDGFTYRGSLTATWADGSTAFTSDYLIELVAWKPRSAVTGNLTSGEVSIGFSRGESGTGDADVSYRWWGGPALAAQNLSPCDHQYGEPTSMTVSAKYLTQAASAPPPVSTAKPTVTGVAKTGQTVRTDDGQWAFFPASLSYQWQRCNAAGAGCSDIAGATSATYGIVAADEQHTLRSVVTACNSGGCARAMSDLTAIVIPLAAPDPVWGARSAGTGADLNAVSCPLSTACFAVGGGGTILATTDAGLTWTAEASGTTTGLLGVSCSDDMNCWAVGAGGLIISTNDGGATWETQPSGTANTLNAVSCTSETQCWAVGAGGTIASTADGGATWVAESSGTASTLYGVSCTGSNSFCAAVGQGGTTVTRDASSPWTYAPAGTADLRAVSCWAEQGCVATGLGGVTYELRTPDWLTQTSATSGNLLAASCLSVQHDCFAVGAGGVLARDDGSGWRLGSSGTASELRGISCNHTAGPADDRDACVAVGSAGALVLTTPPANVGTPPAVSGIPEVGQSLTANDGTWAGTPAPALARQWERCNAAGASCTAIAGATSQSYTPVLGDVGSTLRVSVTATNQNGKGTASSRVTGTVVPAQVPPGNAGNLSDATQAAGNVNPSDPSTPAAPETAADQTLGDTVGIEDSPAGVLMAEEGAPSPDLVLAVLPKEEAAAVENGTLSLAAAAAKTPVFETCGLSFRRKVTKKRDFDYEAYWGARFSCNLKMTRMKFRARIVFTGHDSQPISYGNLINKEKVTNEISYGQVGFTFNPNLVVYVTGDLHFPPPSDPNNYAIAVVSDPQSVNRNKSSCKRQGTTFTVHCNARSLSFTH